MSDIELLGVSIAVSHNPQNEMTFLMVLIYQEAPPCGRVVEMFSTGCFPKESLPFTAGYCSACQPAQEWISLRG